MHVYCLYSAAYGDVKWTFLEYLQLLQLFMVSLNLKSTLKAPIIIYQLNRLEKSDLLKITLTHCGGGDTK